MLYTVTYRMLYTEHLKIDISIPVCCRGLGKHIGLIANKVWKYHRDSKQLHSHLFTCIHNQIYAHVTY